MMILTLIPVWGRPEGALSVAGDVLTRDGVAYDLSPVPEGGEGWPAHPAPGEDHVFIGPIRRIDGTIHATLIVFPGDDAPQGQGPWTVAAGDGPVAIPATRPQPLEIPA